MHAAKCPWCFFKRPFFNQYFFCIPQLRLQEQETPLHCAAWHGYSPVARALCQAGCHVDAKNREGESPLLTASARGFVDIVECLVEHRADLEATDKVIIPEHLSSARLLMEDLFWHNITFVWVLTFYYNAVIYLQSFILEFFIRKNQVEQFIHGYLSSCCFFFNLHKGRQCTQKQNHIC